MIGVIMVVSCIAYNATILTHCPNISQYFGIDDWGQLMECRWRGHS